MEKDNEFLTKVSALFLENGPKAVTMDDVAREMGMSKKTLYKKYRNKEALLDDVLSFGMNRVLRKMKDLDEKIDNAIERMFARDEDLERTSKTNDSILLKQLIKFYPHIFNGHMKDFSKNFADILVHNVERGRKQGYYRTDFDERYYAKMYFQLVMSYDDSPFLDTEGMSRRNHQHKALMFYMNAITTEKGKDYMKPIEVKIFSSSEAD